MALMLHKSALPTFEFAPNPEFDSEISAIKTRYEAIMEGIKTKKISAADIYYSGSSITDQATQTEESEIVDVKSATKVLMSLTEDSKNLKSRLEVFYESSMTEYQDLVNSKANLIYDQCAELLRDIQRQNDATLERTRRAYKQQLADAIASLSSMYQKNMALKLRTVELRQTDISEKFSAENMRLRDRIRQLEDQVTLMTRELGDIERAKALTWDEGEEEMVSVAVSPFVDQNKESAANPATSLKLQLQEATINELKAKIHDCEMIIKARDAQIDQLESELKDLGSSNANQSNEVTRLLMEKARLENEMVSQEDRMKSQPSDSPDPIRARKSVNKRKPELKEKMAALELDIEAAVTAGRAEERALCKREMELALEQERGRYIGLNEEKRRVEAELYKERKVSHERSKEDRDLDAIRSAKTRLEGEVERQRREIDKVHRMWEKKFGILQASLHALKDEMFVRRYLEKQAAQLHTSAVAFVFGKNSAHQDIPKLQDATVRSKTVTGMSLDGQDIKMYSGANSSYDARGLPNQADMAPSEGAGLPFRPPSLKARRTVWDTRPPTQASMTNGAAEPAPDSQPPSDNKS